jgi:hypothetical protein
MDWQEALEVVLARTKHRRYVELCAAEHPDHEYHRRRMIEKATGEAVTCENCPCPASCLRRTAFCRWAGEDPQDETKLRSICLQSGHQGVYAVRTGTPPEPRPPGIEREVVVSRYRGDVSWLDDVTVRFYVSLYDKSEAPYRVARQVRRERIPNVGRETYSMLYHIATYYDDLASWTYFLQDDAPRHEPEIARRLRAAYAGLSSLTRTYTPDDPSPEVHARDRVEWVSGYEVRYGDLPMAPGAWQHVFAGPRPPPGNFGYAAMWAVPRQCIARRPLAFWRWLME